MNSNLAGARILVTGHTGFTGGWLGLLLEKRGASVYGLSLPPAPGSLFERAGLSGRWPDVFADIRDRVATADAILSFSPDAVIHLAAQPLVRLGYAEPLATFSTNAIGTAHVLDAARRTPSVKAVVVVTTDKVYAQDGLNRAFTEDDPLGGVDPYSASKTAAEMSVNAWRAVIANTGNGPELVSMRAGNLVGGGDVAEHRLLPDLVREFRSGSRPAIRHPLAVRPWQHVLDAADGYARAAACLIGGTHLPPAVNLGPDPGDSMTVAQIADLAATAWGDGASWQTTSQKGPPEEESITLVADVARSVLGWGDHWTSQEAVVRTIRWWKAVFSGQDALDVCLAEVADYR